jgi:hypothetical protein
LNRRRVTPNVAGTPKLAARSGRATLVSLLGIALALPASFAVLAPSAFAASNVSFVGTWTPNTGVGWTITRENRTTGVCAGTTRLATSGYRLVACRVTGHKYVFTITYGAGYRSHNSGTITGNTLTGRFKDSNGTVETYTATRRH